jgi:hypothetical protein
MQETSAEQGKLIFITFVMRLNSVLNRIIIVQ